MLVCTPIIGLVAVANSLMLDAANQNRRLQLCCLNFLRPASYHSCAVLNDKLLAHKGTVGPTLGLTGAASDDVRNVTRCSSPRPVQAVWAYLPWRCSTDPSMYTSI